MLHVTKPDTKKRRKRCLLINPPVEEPYHTQAGGARPDPATPATRDYSGRGYAYPLPIGLLRIAGQLLREGHEIYFLDCFSTMPPNHPSSRGRATPSEQPEVKLSRSYRARTFHLGLRYEEIDGLLRGITVDEVLVGCTFTYHNEPAHKVIDIVKGHMPTTPVRFGGIYPTLAPDAARTSRADEVFVGAYPGIEDPSLNYDFLGWPPEFILIKGTSGCPHKCAYCAVHKLEGNRFTHRDGNDVFDEISRAHQRYGLTTVGMWDSNILMQYDRYLGVILRRIIDSGLELRLRAPEGLDYRLMTPQVASDMKEAGFTRVSLALENVDEEFASDRLNRHNSMARLKDAILHLKAAGFEGHNIRLFVIIGLPDQTIENVAENIVFVWSLGCNVTLFPFTPIPGTPLYQEDLPQLRHLPLRALHPSLFPCVRDDHLKDLLIELGTLGDLNRAGKPQAEHFRQVIASEELLSLLS